MNLLDRYILKGVLFTCTVAVGIFVFVLLLGNALRDLLTPVLAGQIGWGLAARLVLMLIPAVAPWALAPGVLTGVLLTLGRLSADSEITAMRAAGIGTLRIARPILILAAIFGFGAFYINFTAMPWARVTYEQEFKEAIRANPMSFVVPQTYIHDFKGYVVFVGDRQGSILRDFWLWKLDDQNRVIESDHSDVARLEYDEASNSLFLTLTPAQVEKRNEKNPEDFSESPSEAKSDLLRVPAVSLDRFFGRDTLRIKQEWMTLAQLDAERVRLAALPIDPEHPKDQPRERMKLELTQQRKLNFAVAVFTFALIGVPLGIRVSRRETSANLGVAVLLGLGFYLLVVMVSWLDRHPEYRPDILIWLPNLIFIGLAVRLFRKLERS